MKKYLLLLICLFSFTFANALEIKDLGFKADDIKGMKIETRGNSDNDYFMKENDIFAYAETEDYLFYIRAVANPGIVDYKINDDLIDEVFNLISKVNTKEYSYIPHGDYKWIRFDYVDSGSRPIIEYFLSWKDVFITVTYIGKYESLTAEEKNKIDLFVSSINLSGKGVVPVSNVYRAGIDYFDEKQEEKKNSYTLEIILCILAIGITFVITRKK